MTMDPRLQAWLDGELTLDDLPEALRDEATAWTRLLDGVRSLPAPGAPPGRAARVLEAVRDERAGGATRFAPLGDGLRWIVRPRTVRVSPLAAAALLVLAVWGGLRLTAAGLDEEVAAAGDGQVYVQFVIAAPEASSVALAGDFSEWTPSIELSDPDRDGVWSGRVALEAGVHEYMFVIDGTEWRPDPNALSYAADGFGRRNSVVAVAPLDET